MWEENGVSFSKINYSIWIGSVMNASSMKALFADIYEFKVGKYIVS